MSVINQQTADLLSQLKSGTYGTSGDVIFHTLYDQVVVGGANILQQEFFTTPIGAIVGSNPKSKAWTNLRDTGKFPAGQAFIAEKMRLGFFNKSATTSAFVSQTNLFYQVLQNCNVEIQIVGREFEAQFAGSLFIPSVAVVGDSAVTVNNVRVGDYFSNASVKLITPVIFSELVSFKVVMTFDPSMSANLGTLNTAGCMFHWDLLGMLARKK